MPTPPHLPALPLPGRALVTGASGFIGAHLARALAEACAELTLLVRPTSDLSRLAAVVGGRLEGAGVRRVDLGAPGALHAEVAAARPEVVFHLAADTRPFAPAGAEAAMDALHVDATGDLAAAALAAGARRLVALSTSDVYGCLPSPHDPEAPAAPRTAYGRSKARADELLRRMSRERGLDVVILRPYHVYGPHQGGRHFVASLVAACVDDRPFPMSDGRQRRDFIHVDDVVRAILRAATAPGAAGRTIDVCTGVATPVVEVARAVAEAAACRDGGPVPGAIARREGEPDEHFGDPARAAELLGWRPEVELREGLARAVAERRIHARSEARWP